MAPERGEQPPGDVGGHHRVAPVLPAGDGQAGAVCSVALRLSGPRGDQDQEVRHEKDEERMGGSSETGTGEASHEPAHRVDQGDGEKASIVLCLCDDCTFSKAGEELTYGGHQQRLCDGCGKHFPDVDEHGSMVQAHHYWVHRPQREP